MKKIIKVPPSRSLNNNEFRRKVRKKKSTRKKLTPKEVDLNSYILSENERQECYNNHYTYNGFIKSKFWKKIRKIVLSKDKHRCIICQSKATQVHHLNYDVFGYEKYKDLESLCYKCHMSQHTNIFIKNGKKYKFTNDPFIEKTTECDVCGSEIRLTKHQIIDNHKNGGIIFSTHIVCDMCESDLEIVNIDPFKVVSDNDLTYLWEIEHESLEECYKNGIGAINAYVGDGVYVTPCGKFEDDVATECTCKKCYPPELVKKYYE